MKNLGYIKCSPEKFSQGHISSNPNMNQNKEHKNKKVIVKERRPKRSIKAIKFKMSAKYFCWYGYKIDLVLMK